MLYIVGAGWYGCHIAATCLAHGYDVRLLDKTNDVFQGSSSKNQNRLHLGYHYPRAPNTIRECRAGFTRFKNTYPHLRKPVEENMYVIAAESQTSAEEFAALFGATSIVPAPPTAPAIFRVAEELILTASAAAHFRKTLMPQHFIQVTDPHVFETVESICRHVNFREGADILINCTYNHLDPQECDHYELYCTLVYRRIGAAPDTPLIAYTVMDGPFFSLYPYDPQRQTYTLTSVPHGVVWRGRNPTEAPTPDTVNVELLRTAVELQTIALIPTFLSGFAFDHAFFSWKTKPVTTNDDRAVRITERPYGLHVWGGKITGIFEAADAVLKYLDTKNYKHEPDVATGCGWMDWICGPVFV